MVCDFMNILKTTELDAFKRVNFMVCELYLNKKNCMRKKKLLLRGASQTRPPRPPVELGLSFEHTLTTQHFFLALIIL